MPERVGLRRPAFAATARSCILESISILLVEDEAMISAMVEDALKEAGFAVTVVARGEQAIHMLEDPGGGYRAVITDVDLADHKTGWDVARRTRELTADIPIIYTSGGGASEWTAMGVPNSVLVAKPFATAQVVTAVSQLLNQGNTPGA